MPKSEKKAETVKTPVWWMSSSDPEACQWRADQSHVDSDIAGLARDPEADALVQQMDLQNVPADEQVTRLLDFFRSKYSNAFLD